MEEQIFIHKSVLLCETVGSLNIKSGGVYADRTLGGGGYVYEACKRLRSGRFIGIDQGADVIAAVGKQPEHFRDKITIVRSSYGNTKTMLEDPEPSKVDGICLDLGISSHQLDKVSGGSTYREDVPLDMRMDQKNTATATGIVNTYEEVELHRIIRDYGEDNLVKSIAKHIVGEREEHPIETTRQLAEIIKNVTPAKARTTDGHPTKRIFQAIRIECNHELGALEYSIDTMIGLLNPGDRLSIITSHSLEDRIIRSRFGTNENPCTCPHEFPVCVCGRRSKEKVISRKPVSPPEKELGGNSRSKSAKLRVFERG